MFTTILCDRDVKVDTNINNSCTFCLFLPLLKEVNVCVISLSIRNQGIWYEHIILYLAYGTVLCMISFLKRINLIPINKTHIYASPPSYAILNEKGMSVSKEKSSKLMVGIFLVRQIEETFRKWTSLIFRQRWANLRA